MNRENKKSFFIKNRQKQIELVFIVEANNNKLNKNKNYDTYYFNHHLMYCILDRRGIYWNQLHG